jgi:hypothetical protein
LGRPQPERRDESCRDHQPDRSGIDERVGHLERPHLFRRQKSFMNGIQVVEVLDFRGH